MPGTFIFDLGSLFLGIDAFVSAILAAVEGLLASIFGSFFFI